MSNQSAPQEFDQVVESGVNYGGVWYFLEENNTWILNNDNLPEA